MVILSSSSHTKHPASLANPSNMKLPTRSLHSQRSSSSFGGLSCITVRRDTLKERAGIKLQQDSKTGEVTISSISEKGLFKDTALEVGDLVLSVNKQRLKKGEGPEVLMDIVRKNKTISIAIKKPAKDKKSGTPLSSKSSHKKNKRSSKRSSKLEKPTRSSSNSTEETADTSSSLYYGGLTQHNADGSAKLLEKTNGKVEKEPLTKTLTISACKPGAPINVSGKSARRLSGVKSSHTRTSIPSRRISNSENNGSPGSMHQRTSRRTSNSSNHGNLVVSGKSSRRLSLERSQHDSCSLHDSILVPQSRRMSNSSNHGNLVVSGKSSRRLSLERSQHDNSCSLHDSSHDNSEGSLGSLFAAGKSSFFPRRLSGSSHLSGGSYGTTNSSKQQRKKRASTRSSNTTHRRRSSTSKKSSEASVGLRLKVVNKQLEVIEIREESIFKGTELKVGDKILSINDMSFRRYADAEYAFTLMDKASLLVTLVVERIIGEENDDTASTDDDVSSFSSFCNDVNDLDFQTSAADPNAPLTITISKAFKRQDAGLTFKQTNRSCKKNTRVFVEKIARDSPFRKTALKKGDRVLIINNTDLRSNPDTNLAYDACMESNESIVLVILRKENDPRSTSNKEVSFSCGDWNIEL